MKNIIALFRVCSRLNNLLGHPYFVEFTGATNYYTGDVENGEIEDMQYATLHLGRYHDDETKKHFGIDEYEARLPPLHEMYFFGPVPMILNLRALERLFEPEADWGQPPIENEEEKNWELAAKNIEQFRRGIDNVFLSTRLSKEEQIGRAAKALKYLLHESKMLEISDSAAEAWAQVILFTTEGTGCPKMKERSSEGEKVNGQGRDDKGYIQMA